MKLGGTVASCALGLSAAFNGNNLVARQMAYGQIPTACGSACGDMEAYLSKYANLCVSASTSDQMECIGSLCAPAFMATAPPCLSCLDDSAASTGAALKALIDQLAPACAQAGFPVDGSSETVSITGGESVPTATATVTDTVDSNSGTSTADRGVETGSTGSTPGSNTGSNPGSSGDGVSSGSNPKTNSGTGATPTSAAPTVTVTVGNGAQAQVVSVGLVAAGLAVALF